MIFQPIRRTAGCVATTTVGSYPAFSPLPRRIKAVIFCYATWTSQPTSR